MDSNQVINPILLQRQCDGGKGEMAPEEWARLVAERLAGHPTGFMGCGTTFQWWWGSNCVCPGCGRTFMVTLDNLKKYRVQEYSPRIDEREIEESILRNVLVRLGRY